VQHHGKWLNDVLSPFFPTSAIIHREQKRVSVNLCCLRQTRHHIENAYVRVRWHPSLDNKQQLYSADYSHFPTKIDREEGGCCGDGRHSL
jgi:hypothetical protein